MAVENMNLAAIKHIPKSPMCYAYDANTLHIYLQTARDDATSVELIIGDPFEYTKVKNDYLWTARTKPFLGLERAYSDELHDNWFGEVTVPSKRSKYAFLIHSGNRTYFYGCRRAVRVNMKKNKDVIFDLANYFNFPYINEEDLCDSPKWTQNVTWYLIFPERFNRSQDSQGAFIPWGSIESGIKNDHFFGGDIKGIMEKIPYLKDLGITGIYFTPIFEATSAHKYDTIDYFKIDPQFGTNEDFKKLVEKCHAAGIRVMLDAVFNHCGWFHPFFQDVIRNKRQSPYWDCFYIEDEHFLDGIGIDAKGAPVATRDLKPKFRTFATTPWMPKLKSSNPFMEQYLLSVATYWVKECDIDGWRLDVSNEVSHHFWRKFKEAVRSIKPDIFILGENWDDSNAWLQGDQLDAVMNYEIAYPVWQFFGAMKDSDRMDGTQFAYAINNLIVRYPKNVAKSMFNLIGSHDTMRVLTRFNGNKDIVRLAYLFIFSFCGSPAICYGDEIGLEGKHDPDCRRCMIWDESRQDRGMLAFFRNLIALRKAYDDFRLVDIKWLATSRNVLMYQKGHLIFIINNNDYCVELTFDKTVKDLETDLTKAIGKLVIKPYGYRIFEEQSI